MKIKSFTALAASLFLSIGVALSQVTFPSLDPTNPESLMEVWQFIYAFVTPIGIWAFTKFWPSSTKSELIIKSTSIAILILIIVLFFKGFTFMNVAQAFIAFIMQVIAYDKVLKPMGLEGAKDKYYPKK